MLSEPMAVRSEARSVSALNALLVQFDAEFTPIRVDDFLSQQERIERGAEILARHHLQAVGIVEDTNSLRLPMLQWSATGGNNSQSRFLLERTGVNSPYNLGYLWGCGVEKPMAKRFAELLQKSDHYQPSEENPRGKDLPMQLWKLV